LATVSSFAMAQSFGFWRIALSSFVAVFIELMISYVISLRKLNLPDFLVWLCWNEPLKVH
jgi:hypothetical protein